MPWPNPVVCILTEIADAGWRCPNEAHIFKCFGYEKIVLIGLKEAPGKAFLRSFFFYIFPHFRQIFINGSLPFRFRHAWQNPFHRLGGHIINAHNKGGKQTFVRNFFSIVLCPEAIPDVIFFEAGMILNGIKAAMVVGEHQAFCRNNLAGAKSAKAHDGIF